MIPESEPEIRRDDGTPSLADQCKARGWDFAYYNFGKAEEEGVDWFNPGLVQRPDGLWLLVRRSLRENLFGKNDVCAIKLDESGRIPAGGKALKWMGASNEEQHEDARGAYHAELDQVAIVACNFIWHGFDQGWTGATQVLGFFDRDWECKVKHRPPIEGNPAQLEKIEPKHYQKNWTIFFHEGKLHILYKSKPWIIFRFGETWEDREYFTHKDGVTWKWGDIRGGTPPVLVNGLYWTFHHSSLPWKGNYRRYFAGAIAFEAKPPFRPVLITKEPIFTGSQRDRWEQRKPVCVFPCGAVFRDGKWLISMGINDLVCGWCELPHESLLPLMVNVGESSGQVIFPSTGLSDEEKRKEKLRANAARARAALAEKRAKGLVKRTKSCRSRVQSRASKRQVA